MLEIITINKKNKESNNKLWKNLLLDSYNNYYKKNDYNKSIKDSLDLLWDYLDISELQLVLKSNKYIGFFINTLHKQNKEISFKIFPHPLSCPMSLRSLTKAATCRSIMLFSGNNDYTYFEFVTWHPALITAIKTYIPDITISILSPTYINCYYEFNISTKNRSLGIVLKYLENSKQYDYNNFKIIY